MSAVLLKTLEQVAVTLSHTWPYLLLAVLVAAAMKVYVDGDRLRGWLHQYREASVLAATGVAVATPLCSCGTMAVVLAMLATTAPWAPVVAFMVASPLSSPGQLLFTAGLFGWPFALAHLAVAILLGLVGGLVAGMLESRGWLAGQARLAISGGSDAPVAAAVAPAAGDVREGGSRLAALGRAAAVEGGRLAMLFVTFAFVGYLLNNLIPAAWITELFGAGKVWGVLLAATLGLPLYVNSDASLPLVRTFLDSGASPGAALAFLITGAGTSVGAVVGALTIARWRVLAVVVGTLWVGAVIAGHLYNLVAQSLS